MKFEIETAVEILDTVIRLRKSVRAFRSDPVPKRPLMEIVEAARAAPSNYNSQPWRVYLLTGKAKDALGEAITRATTPIRRLHFRLSLSRCLRIARRVLMSSPDGIIQRLALTGLI